MPRGLSAPWHIIQGAIMEYIRVTKDNIEKEHICCAISNNKDVQVSSKKAWLLEQTAKEKSNLFMLWLQNP